MNQRLLEPICKKYLPHQLACVDWVLHQLEHRKNLLLFHKPGTGKTLIGTLLVEVLTQVGFSPIIAASNKNILAIWETHLLQNSETYIPRKFATKTSLTEMLTQIIDHQFDEDLSKTVLVIDEAHEILNTDLVDKFLLVQETVPIRMIMLTGTPIINSPSTLVKLLKLLSNQDFSHVITSTGSVIDIKLKPEYEDSIVESIRGTVSYYAQSDDLVASMKYINLELKMSKKQDEIFQQARSNTTNEMFQQTLNNTSLFGVANFYKYESVAELTDGQSIGEGDRLVYNNGLLSGIPITDVKSFSCKFHELRSRMRGRGKMFLYLSNPGYGMLFLSSYFHYLQIENNDKPTLYNNPMCTCGEPRSSHKVIIDNTVDYSNETILCEDGRTFSPMKYVAITSLTGVDPNYAIDLFNKESNVEGDEIKMIIGSDIISVGYTLKEISSVHFLSLPINKGQEEQIVKRAIRLHAHKDPMNTIVNVYRYIAMPSTGDGFDQKRLQYIDIKYSNVGKVDMVLIRAHTLIDKVPHEYFRRILTKLLVRPPSIRESFNRADYHRLGFTPDETVLNESLYVDGYVITKDQSNILQIPIQDYIITKHIVFLPINYTTEGSIIIARKRTYYYTEDLRTIRSLSSMSKESLIKLYEMFSKKVAGVIRSRQSGDSKNDLINSIVSTVVGTKYFLISKIDIVNRE